jgi:formate C-acetyltransferase
VTELARRARRVLDRAREQVAGLAAPAVMHAALRAMALALRFDARLAAELSGVHPLGLLWAWRADVAFATRDGRHRAVARFRDGRLRVLRDPDGAPDVTVTFAGPAEMRAFFEPGADPLNMILDGGVTIAGNLTHLTKFSHFTKVLQHRGARLAPARPPARYAATGSWRDLAARPTGEPSPLAPHAGETRWLDDPSLTAYTLDDFPRVKRLLHAHRTTQPEICVERAALLTDEVVRRRLTPESPPPSPALRQARAIHAILTRKRPIIYDDDLLAGTTTSRRIGVQLYPETHGTTIWPELLTVGARAMNPYRITDDDVRTLATEVFPFWIDENVREHTKRRDGSPLSLLLDERFRLYFQWKHYAVSHTVADLPAVLDRGLAAIADDARRRGQEREPGPARELCAALALAQDGVLDYARRLARHAEARAAALTGHDPETVARRAELGAMARRCEKVPAAPPDTFEEAVQAIWIVFLALHQENVNAGLSLGRLDVWLDPYLARDLERAATDDERRRTIERALEITCALMLKLTDHVPLVPDLGNRLFGGSSSDQVITLGGVRRDGSSAVCDTTWIFLKATEMLALRDPNMNARYAPGVCSEAYLRRLCEVNLITGATPSLHNDAAMIPALEAAGFAARDAWDWSATGCVEPTICGKHFGHTGCLMINAVAALELCLHDGAHPGLGPERIGPATGAPTGLATFADVLAATEAQLAWVLDMAVDGNNRLGRTHQELKPTPLLSALFQGPLETGRDVVDGGAVYNSTGVAIVGLPDVVDSLTAIEDVVFVRRRATMGELLDALAADFVGHEPLLADILTRVPKLGADDERPLRLARRLMATIASRLGAADHYRGGRYLPGYWSMSNHVAFGLLSGALPSGRLRGKPFAPGLTPSPACLAPLPEQIRAIASLDATAMPNNLAFNVKVVPGGADDRRKVVDRMAAYAAAYFDLGGMQMQLNVVDSETLRDAVRHPEAHGDLLVRVSGYNAYFVDLSRPMQEELIERTAHHVLR